MASPDKSLPLPFSVRPSAPEELVLASGLSAKGRFGDYVEKGKLHTWIKKKSYNMLEEDSRNKNAEQSLYPVAPVD